MVDLLTASKLADGDATDVGGAVSRRRPVFIMDSIRYYRPIEV